MKKEKATNSKLKVDIKNAEKFFNKTGKDISEVYKLDDDNLGVVNNSGVTNMVIYIPGAKTDLYTLNLN